MLLYQTEGLITKAISSGRSKRSGIKSLYDDLIKELPEPAIATALNLPRRRSERVKRKRFSRDRYPIKSLKSLFWEETTFTLAEPLATLKAQSGSGMI